MAWTYEQLFNALNDGNLTGQDSWTGANSLEVQTTTKFEGAKGLKGTGASNQINDRAIAGVTEGTFYIAMKLDASGANNAGLRVYFMDGAYNQSIIVGVHRTAAGTYYIFYERDTKTNFQVAALDTWYVFEIVFDGANSRFKLRIHTEGVGWGTQSDWIDARGTCSEIDSIRLVVDSSNGVTAYIDTITPTNPKPPPVVGRSRAYVF